MQKVSFDVKDRIRSSINVARDQKKSMATVVSVFLLPASIVMAAAIFVYLRTDISIEFLSLLISSCMTASCLVSTWMLYSRMYSGGWQKLMLKWVIACAFFIGLLVVTYQGGELFSKGVIIALAPFGVWAYLLYKHLKLDRTDGRLHVSGKLMQNYVAASLDRLRQLNDIVQGYEQAGNHGSANYIFQLFSAYSRKVRECTSGYRHCMENEEEMEKIVSADKEAAINTINTLYKLIEEMDDIIEETGEFMPGRTETNKEKHRQNDKSTRQENYNSEDQSRERQGQQTEDPRRQSKSSYVDMYFKGCKNADEVKARYRKLVKAFHPDDGGDAEAFQMMQEAYKEALDSV